MIYGLGTHFMDALYPGLSYIGMMIDYGMDVWLL